MVEAQNPLTPRPVRLAADFTADLPTPSRVLAIGAHPDDVDFGCGATLAKWTTRGCTVNVLVCTDGSKGTWDPTVDTAELVATRRAEQRAAAETLGVDGEIGFLDQVDGELSSALAVRAEVARWIRRTRPNVVIGHDPWKRYRLHPDHRHAGLLAVEGVVAARDPLFFPDQEVPHHRPDLLLLFEAQEPDHAEDVTGFLEAKAAALLAHASQYESTMEAGAGSAALDEAVRDLAVTAGRAAGMAHAEVFKLIDDL
jgi:LmbE family N-acetylglucosaminyl deacetylase